jgi:hypothetical protein
MAKVVPLNRLLKVLIFTLVAMACLILGATVSDSLFARPDASLSMKWVGVLVGTLSIVPWMVTVLWGISVGDEFVRRIALVGTAVAFAIDLVVHVAFNLLQDAKIVSWSTHLPAVPLAILLWMLGVGATTLYYRYRP